MMLNGYTDFLKLKHGKIPETDPVIWPYLVQMLPPQA